MAHASTDASRGDLWGQAGRVLAGLAVVLAPLAFVAALPGFNLDLGMWPQAEAGAALSHFLGALALLGLLLMLLGGDGAARAAIAHPVVLAPALIGLCGVLALPFCDAPVISMMGHPALGWGILAHFDIAAICAAALALKGRRWFTAGLTVMALATVGLFWLQLEEGGRYGFAPYFFPDWLGFPALLTATALLARLAGQPLWVRALVVLWAGLVLLGSGNLAALGLGMLLAGATMLQARLPLPAPALSAGVVAGSVILPLMLLALAPRVPPPVPAEGGGWAQAAASLWSRAGLARVTMADLLDHPAGFFTGLGWGRVEEAISAHSQLVHSRSWNLPPDQMQADAPPLWDAPLRHDVHSHSLLLEALHGGGAAALILCLIWIGAPLVRPAAAGPALAVAATLGILGGFWFLAPAVWPFVALASAAVVTPVPQRRAPAFAPMLLPLMVLLAAGGLFGLAQGLRVRDARLMNNAGLSLPPEQCGLLARPLGMADAYEPALARHLASVLERRRPGPADAGRLGAALRGLAPHPGPLAAEPCAGVPAIGVAGAETGLDLRPRLIRLADNHLVLQRVVRRSAESWAEDLSWFLLRAPGRVDMVPPLLDYRLAAGDGAMVQAYLIRIGRTDKRHPVRLWYAGELELLAHRPDALPYLNEARMEGIDRFLPPRRIRATIADARRKAAGQEQSQP